MGAGLRDQREQVGRRDAHVLLDLLEPLVQDAGVDGRILLGLRVLRSLEGIVDLLDVVEEVTEALQVILINLQLEIEFREIRPQAALALLEFRQRLLALGVGARLQVLAPSFTHRLFSPPGGFDQLGQRLEVGLPAVDLLVDDDPVEALLAIEELLAERDDMAADDAGMEQGLLGVQLRVLDALGDLHLLLARQQRHLAHLLQIHADGIVENVVLGGAGLLLLGFLLPLLVTVDLLRIQNVDLEILEDGNDVLDVLGVVDALRQGVIDVVESQIPLLLREADQVADLLVDVGAAGGNFRARRRAAAGRCDRHGSFNRNGGGRRFHWRGVVGRLGFARHGNVKTKNQPTPGSVGGCRS